jgi:glutathione S-transferase
VASSIVLHQWEISPFCQKVARALRFKGLSYETVNYNGLLAAKVGRLSKVGKLPVLDIDGKRIQDSTRIARYLDGHQPKPALYPADPQQRALAENCCTGTRFTSAPTTRLRSMPRSASPSRGDPRLSGCRSS